MKKNEDLKNISKEKFLYDLHSGASAVPTLLETSRFTTNTWIILSVYFLITGGIHGGNYFQENLHPSKLASSKIFSLNYFLWILNRYDIDYVCTQYDNYLDNLNNITIPSQESQITFFWSASLRTVPLYISSSVTLSWCTRFFVRRGPRCRPPPRPKGSPPPKNMSKMSMGEWNPPPPPLPPSLIACSPPWS